MRCTLIFPRAEIQTKQTMPPLGIAWIAAVLRENGFPQVKLIDSHIENYSNEDVINKLKEQDPDIVGLSFGTQNRFVAIDLLRQIRKTFPKIYLVAGGSHPTLTAPDLLEKVPEVDIVVRGEGERSFLELVKAINKKSGWSQIKGISYRDHGGRIYHNAPVEPIMDLDSLPMPARDLLPMDKYYQTIPYTGKLCTNMMTSRGCPYHCIYCSAAKQWDHSIRFRSPDHVVREIEHLVKTYPIGGVSIFDEVFTMNKQRAIAICRKIIDKKLNINWWCEARANTIDKEIAVWMRKAGCVYIAMAIESGSPRILKNIKKAITIEQAMAAVKVIKDAGLKLKVFFMHGLPGETYEDIKKTVFLSRILHRKYKVDDIMQTMTFIFPGTEIEQIAKEIGSLPKDFSWNTYFEENRSYAPLGRCQYVPVFEQPNLSYEQVFQYVRRAKIIYYLKHPFHLLKNLLKHKKAVIKTLTKWLTTRIKKNESY